MERFSDLRRKAGYATQELFAAAVGVDRSVVAKWEIGENYPKTPLIPKIAKLLNTTADDVIQSVEFSKNSA